MYIRWNVRRHERRRQISWYPFAETVTRSAALVRSERVDGKPRQHIVAWLGSVNETVMTDAGNPWWGERTRRLFWRSAAPRLARLVEDGTLTPEQRTTFEEALARVVAQPTDEELRRWVESEIAMQTHWLGRSQGEAVEKLRAKGYDVDRLLAPPPADESEEA